MKKYLRNWNAKMVVAFWSFLVVLGENYKDGWLFSSFRLHSELEMAEELHKWLPDLAFWLKKDTIWTQHLDKYKKCRILIYFNVFPLGICVTCNEEVTTRKLQWWLMFLQLQEQLCVKSCWIHIYLRDSELEIAERTTKMAAILCNLSISRKLQHVAISFQKWLEWLTTKKGVATRKLQKWLLVFVYLT